jgi:DNA-damage-inducible protein J
MIENSVVRARIDAATKAKASAVLASIGLSLTDAIRLMLKWVVAEKEFPFEPLIPNAETIEAIKAVRRGKLTTVASLDGLFKDLNVDD